MFHAKNYLNRPIFHRVIQKNNTGAVFLRHCALYNITIDYRPTLTTELNVQFQHWFFRKIFYMHSPRPHTGRSYSATPKTSPLIWPMHQGHHCPTSKIFLKCPWVEILPVVTWWFQRIACYRRTQIAMQCIGVASYGALGHVPPRLPASYFGDHSLYRLWRVTHTVFCPVERFPAFS